MTKLSKKERKRQNKQVKESIKFHYPSDSIITFKDGVAYRSDAKGTLRKVKEREE
jgi:hypothetical protein